VLSWLANAWRVPELRRRLLFTAFALVVYRLGSWIPAPGVDATAIEGYFDSQGGGVFGLLNLFSGGALSQFSLFALGIMPYVTASIIVQLLTVVIPRLAELQKEGEAGYAKINQYTRYLTVVLASLQALGYAFLFKSQNVNGQPVLEANAGRMILIIVTLTAGTTFLMWVGEQITKRGVGNGISILIFASILTGLPIGITAWWNGGPMERIFYPLIALLVVSSVVFVQEGQRRIPIQYAKRMVGRRLTTGGSTYLPLRVNMAGVIPVIFAAALLAFPPTIAQYIPATNDFVSAHFGPSNWLYICVEGVMIVVFAFFYTAVQFNPVEQADNLRKQGGYIPGIRPGPPTAQYLDRVLTRLTLPGALFLALIAVAPSLFIRYGGFSQASAGALGGTSVLIAVGVALDTMRQMESQMMMRNYEGFLK
jgi:preprotein translocase subunit SecY